MPELTVEFEVWCNKCNRGLCHSVVVDQSKGNRVYVEPCCDCLASSRQDGYDDGHDDGYFEGLDEAKRSSELGVDDD